MRSLILLALLGAGGALAQPAPPSAAGGAAYSVVEPKTPAKATAAARKRAARANAAALARSREKRETLARAEQPLRANGPCVIKPVMSDQDLVNCGATPQH